MGKRRQTLKRKTLFLDSSVLFSAVNSSIGGSAKLFTLKNIQIVTSKTILTEVEKNIRNKLTSFHLNRFFTLVSKLDILSQIPDKELIKKAQKVIVEKDAVILSEAKKADCDYLVTLDKKHFLIPKVISFLKPQIVVTPAMFFIIWEEKILVVKSS